ncbi:MAG: thioredoxin family protein [Kangiella sp.]|nr:MAG: thioredoxin family protein [Kangiella sp.]
MKNFIWIVALFLSLSLKAEILVGEIPPSYLGKDKNGVKIELSEMKGKVVVATFWATWCPPCLKEMEVLENIQRQVGKDKLEVVAINFKEGRSKYKRIVKLLKDAQITLTYDRRGIVAKRYNIKSIPRMFIINKLGKISYMHKGYGEKMLAQIVDELNALITAS